jgi:class 3 adenylate cyclase
VLYLRQIEAEKKRADGLLRVILPDEIVEELTLTNEVKPRRYDHVAVLFCDIVGFTTYCDTHDAQEVIANLQILVEAYEEIALRHGLQKIKTIGDSFMGVAGLLRPVKAPVMHCIRCGQEMIAAAQALPAMWKVRVGIHVGPVVAGVIGRRQYLFDLWGDSVNMAARMESHGIPGAITLSKAAWRDVAARCVGESLGSVAVKGKGQAEMYRFDGLRPPRRSAPARGPAGAA